MADTCCDRLLHPSGESVQNLVLNLSRLVKLGAMRCKAKHASLMSMSGACGALNVGSAKLATVSVFGFVSLLPNSFRPSAQACPYHTMYCSLVPDSAQNQWAYSCHNR